MALRVGRRTFLAGAGALLVACAAPEAAVPSPAVRRQRVTLSWPADTGYPSPFAFSAVGPGGVVKLMLAYDTLTWKDERGIIPWLAERWTTSDDGRSHTFTIRDGVRFHDGHALTADDVAFTFGYFARFPFKWTPTTVVERAEAVDPRTVRITLAAPHAPFLEDIAGTVPILPRHIWEAVTDPLAFRGDGATVGSGPFALASYADGRGEYLYRAQDRHFAGRPAVSEVAYVLVPDAQRTIALQTHAADVYLATEYELVTAFANGDPYRVFTTPGLSVMRLILNVDRAPLHDVRVRQAIAHALDRADLASRVTHAPDVIVGSAGLIPPDAAWASPTVRQYPFDPARARALLDSAGLLDRDGDGLRELTDGAPLVLDLIANPAIPDGGLVV
ncbi:MAG TPA: ABC transporter substrate-binding protein, partial [Candidatus Saccharimonadales bacterium]|nr:ABC transporter substrate-binding protein [Candidatus Saccharimonadales bacterium]